MLNSNEIAGFRDTWNDWLDHTCSIVRRTQTGSDAWNQPTYDWGVISSEVPCKYWEETDNEIVGTVNAVVSKTRLALPADVDVAMEDRIEDVVSWLGATVPGVFEVKEILEYASGQVLILEDVS